MTPQQMAALHGLAFTTPRPWTAAEFADLLASPLVFALTRPDGFLLGRTVAGEAEILTLAVDPAQRRKGTGRALVAEFLLRAQAGGADSAFLEVAADNDAAQGLYLQAGFAIAGRRRGYYHGPNGAIDAIVMTRAL